MLDVDECLGARCYCRGCIIVKLGKIALFGAAGAVGHALAPVLASRGEKYRVVGRDVSKLQAFEGAEVVAADFLVGSGVDAAAAGIDTVIYLAGAPYTHFEQHPIMTRNALEAAKRAGVSRFVHVAPVYSYEQWFRGANPVLGFEMPIDVLSKGRYADVLSAVKNIAEEE